MNPYHQRVAEIATGLQHTRGRSSVECKTIIQRQLEAEGWYCSTRFKVPSRGTNDHYRGILDLVAWPPPFPEPEHPERKPNPHISNRPPPVLVELDKVQVRYKTRAKLAAFNHPASARVVILTQANDSESMAGIDAIICLGT